MVKDFGKRVPGWARREGRLCLQSWGKYPGLTLLKKLVKEDFT